MVPVLSFLAGAATAVVLAAVVWWFRRRPRHPAAAGIAFLDATATGDLRAVTLVGHPTHPPARGDGAAVRRRVLDPTARVEAGEVDADAVVA